MQYNTKDRNITNTYTVYVDCEISSKSASDTNVKGQKTGGGRVIIQRDIKKTKLERPKTRNVEATQIKFI